MKMDGFEPVIAYIDDYTCYAENVKDIFQRLKPSDFIYWMNRNNSDFYGLDQIEEKTPVQVVLELICECGESQAEIGDLCGVTPSLVSKWISGKRKPHKYQWFCVAFLLNLPVELLEGFMNMAGFYTDFLYREDIILSYALKNRLHRYEIYTLLTQYGCEKAAEFFAYMRE